LRRGRSEASGHDVEEGPEADAGRTRLRRADHDGRPVDEGVVRESARAGRGGAEGWLRRGPALQRGPGRDAVGGRGDRRAEGQGDEAGAGGAGLDRARGRAARGVCGSGPVRRPDGRTAGGGARAGRRGGPGMTEAFQPNLDFAAADQVEAGEAFVVDLEGY